VIGTLVVDNVDEHQCQAIEALGMAAVATDTIMADATVSAALAKTLLELPLTG
jgi:uncharacterized protein YlxP (DUF503 family)